MLDKWYGDIGKKIKGLAFGTFILEAIASVITGIGLMASDDDLVPVGILVLFAGPISSYVLSLFIFAFGELVDKACDIERNTRGKKPQTKKQEEPKTDYYEPSGKVKVIAKDDTFIDLICPHCGKQVSFARDTKSASCPWCDANINLQ